MSEVRSNVLSMDSELDDQDLDAFLRVIRETSSFETQSVQYFQFPNEIVASCSNNSVQIIGGKPPNRSQRPGVAVRSLSGGH